METDLFGSLPSHWNVLPLGEICKKSGGGVQTGPYGSQLHASDYVPVGIPFVMPQNIGDNQISTRIGIARITSNDAERLGRYALRKGDILYSRRGDVKRRALIRDREDGWVWQQVQDACVEYALLLRRKFNRIAKCALYACY